MDAKTIRDRVEAFKLAHASERAALHEVEERRVDVKIAERGHDQFEIERAEAALGGARQEWYRYYTACKDQAKALAAALGFDRDQISALKGAL